MADIINFSTREVIEKDKTDVAFEEFCDCLIQADFYNNRADELAFKYGFEIIYDAEVELD